MNNENHHCTGSFECAMEFKGKIDWEKLKEAIKIGFQFLYLEAVRSRNRIDSDRLGRLGLFQHENAITSKS